MDECIHRSRAVSSEVQATCRRATKSVCVVPRTLYTSSLRMSFKKKSHKSGDFDSHRTGPSRSIQRSWYLISSQSCAEAQKCDEAPS
ncbi:hypothetical protein TNCV_4471061 [Trichonephila clavipes]|uniref:Uncharacterized protein n=1 Tax=Trichonephila clavipes TaxID=2585209 RepID=A0A8X6VLU7_TRICX|nr:hypothetical protein TNCV_4471061 [Trichonephila clavipes]